ncbi:MAG: sulfatase-like hydrolase/transferase [Verrucomicrobiota bacterium]|nr:sulfatase-like hydrolase/transferase [Verrucomicrobiota bacterium]
MNGQPNILWIVTTQWRAQACGYAGDPNARTPCLDALTAESINFSQAVTPHPFGPFARAALLTGVPSPGNGVRDYFDPLPPGARTIAHELGERGYATAFFGKWHLWKRDPDVLLVGEGHAKIVVPPEARGGFEFWEGFESGFLLHDPWLHGTRLEQPKKFEGYQADVLGERAARWIADLGLRTVDSAIRNPKSKIRNAPKPWFCVVSLEAPHPPYDAPVVEVEPRDPGEIILPANVPRGGEIEAKVRRELAGYYAHIEATDRAIGRLLGRLGRENAVVVFTSVHGDMHGAHGLFRKGWPHEESIRVPLLVRGAGNRRWVMGDGWKGTSDAAVSLLDVPQWTLAWAEGRQLKTSKPEAALQCISMPSVVRLPHQCERAWRGVRSRERKLAFNADGSPWLFFDLARDPLELHNLVGETERAEEMAALRAQIKF